MTAPPALKLADIVERTGLSPDTLRYYEREGLIGPVTRHSGQRRYSEDDVSWIGILSCLRDAGLGIADLRRFTTLLRAETGASEQVEFLRRHRDELQERVRRTQAALTVLDEKIAYYAGGSDTPP